jgi:hypothetical protein
VTSAVTSVANTVESAAKSAVSAVAQWASINKQFTKDLSLSEYPLNAQTPWGSGYTMYNGSDIQAYCVGCGANGQVHLTATLIFSLTEGLKEGSVAANGSLHSVFQLGIVAAASVVEPFPNVTILTVPLAGLELPGIVTIGPTITLGAGRSLTIDASGQLLAGVILDWPSVYAKVDVAAISSSTATGFTPNVNPVFQANGQLSAVADAHLAIGIGFTVNILSGKFEKSAQLVDQPGVTVNASVSASAQLVDGQVQGQIGDGSCAGISISANAYADLAGTDYQVVQPWISSSLTQCIALPGGSGSNTASTVTSTTNRQTGTGAPSTDTGASSPTDTGAASSPTDTGVASSPTDTGAASSPTDTPAASSPTDNGGASSSTDTGSGSSPLDTGAASPATDTGKIHRTRARSRVTATPPWA